MTSKKLVSQDDRNAADFGLDRIGDEALVMCLVVHFMDLFRGRQNISGKLNFRIQRDGQHAHPAFRILVHDTHGDKELIPKGMHVLPLLGRDTV